MKQYECPACKRLVKPTRAGNIQAHYDSIRRDPCPAEGAPFYITRERQPEFAGVAS